MTEKSFSVFNGVGGSPLNTLKLFFSGKCFIILLLRYMKVHTNFLILFTIFFVTVKHFKRMVTNEFYLL